MRKLFLLSAVAFVIANTPAISQKTSFGIEAGTSLANIHVKYSGGSIDAKEKIGITAGVTADVPLAHNFSFRPALNFVQKGYKYSDIDYTDKLTLNYIEISMNVLFKPKMSGLQFFVGAGPSVAFALSGKEKENDYGTITTYKVEFGNNEDEDDMKGVDFGANLITGIQLRNGFLVSINYDLGINNLLPGNPDEGSLKSKYWGFKIGYMFGRR